MRWLLTMGALICAAACGNEVTTSEGPPKPGIREDGTVDPALCESGAFDANGDPVVTGDPCYDQWAASLAASAQRVEDTMASYRDACAALALALGASDTWSSLPTTTDQATAACAAARDADTPSDVTCDVMDGADCASTATCTSTTDPPPIDLAVYEAALGALGSLCCDAGSLFDPGDFIPPTLCVPAPGTEGCLVDLFSGRAFQSFGVVIASACGGAGIP